jgi:hypothetical protein
MESMIKMNRQARQLRRRAKHLLAFTMLTALATLTATQLQAQSFAEWFSQKKTQKKYLLQQIAALQIYIGYARKGYDIASSGLNTVKDITNGEFSLHNTFISSLKAVNPAIRSNAKVAEIIALQLAINKTFNGIQTGSLSLSNQLYFKDVKDNIRDECSKDLEELLLVITSGKVEMTDDERIKRLDKVYAAMQDKSAFTQSFCNEVSLLARQRENEQESINQINKFYGINN